MPRKGPAPKRPLVNDPVLRTVSRAAFALIMLLAVLLLLVLGYFFLEFVLTASSSPVWWPVTAFLAGLSLVVIGLVMLLADRWDPQPFPLLLIAVFWGAAIAAFGSYWINSLNSLLVYMVTGSEAAVAFAGPVISAPLVEETTKGAGLRALLDGPLVGQDIEVWTIGDSWNDLTMHALADHSHSFPYSPADVQAATDHVIGSVAEVLGGYM